MPRLPLDQSSPAPEGITPIAEERLWKLVDHDRGLLSEIVELFGQDAPVWIQSMREAIEADDGEALRDGSHALKGALANFAADAAAETAALLELRGREGNLDGCSELFERLERQLAAVTGRLQALVG